MFLLFYIIREECFYSRKVKQKTALHFFILFPIVILFLCEYINFVYSDVILIGLSLGLDHQGHSEISQIVTGLRSHCD